MKSKRKTFKYTECDYECTPKDILHISKGNDWNRFSLDELSGTNHFIDTVNT